MHIEWKLTADGIATLLAGIIAFIAVMIQIRSSSKTLQKQLDADKHARAQDHETLNRAVATAILFEVNSLYRHYVRDVYEAVKDRDPATCKLAGIRSISRQPFSVYSGSTSNLGALGEELAQAIVGFYSEVDAYLCALRDYKTESERYYENPSLVAEEKARTFLGQIKDAGPELTKAAFLVCTKLCEKAGVEFRSPVIAVAAQNLSVAEIAASLKGPDAQTD